MAKTFRQFSERASRAIAETVRRDRARQRNETPPRKHPREPRRPFIRAQLTTTLSYRGTATANVLEPAPSDTTTGETVTVTDGMLNSGDSVSSGSIVLCSFVAGKWVPYSWACP